MRDDVEQREVSQNWRWEFNGENIDLYDATGCLIIRVYGYAGTVIDRERDRIARLVAGAPDLLQAVKGLLMCSLPVDMSGQRFIDNAREALRKAESA